MIRTASPWGNSLICAGPECIAWLPSGEGCVEVCALEFSVSVVFCPLVGDLDLRLLAVRPADDEDGAEEDEEEEDDEDAAEDDEVEAAVAFAVPIR